MDVDARVARALRLLPVIWRVRTALGILLVSTHAIGAVVVFCLIALREGAGDEAAHWEPLEPIVVRGRSAPTAVMTPADAP